MEKIFVRPVPLTDAATAVTQPRLVRKPVGTHLAQEGESVERDSYWLRRIADGDVEEATPPAADTSDSADR